MMDIISQLKQQYKHDMANTKPVSYQSRTIWGTIMFLMSIFCFWIKEGDEHEAILQIASIVFLVISTVLFCKFIPISVVDYPKEKKGKLILIMLSLGGLFLGTTFLLFINSEALFCSKLTNTCEIRDKHFWQTEFQIKSSIPLSSIHNAYIKSYETRSSSSGGYHNFDKRNTPTTMYYLVINTSSGELKPFSSSSSERSEYEKKATLVNNFLKNNEKYIDIQEKNGIFFLASLIFLLIGLYPLIKTIQRKYFS